MTVLFDIDTVLDKILIKFVHWIVLSFKVDHWTGFTFFINKEEAWNRSIFSHLGIISTKCRSYMYNSRTIFSCYVVTENDTESLTFHFHELILTGLPFEDVFRVALSKGLHIISSVLV